MDPELMRLADATLLVPFPSTTAPAWVLRAVENGLGGVVLFANNIAGREQVARLTTRLHNAGSPIIAIDEEGGDVTRLSHRSGSLYPGNAALGALDDPATTRRVSRAIGAELADLGITVNLAPSVDVNTQRENPVIGTRSFGDDASLVSRHAAAAVTGMCEAGVAACAKHFPGHGATRRDSHLQLPTVDADPELLRERDLAPFRAAIDAGVPAILTAHVRVPAVTGDVPATLSPAALGELLRGEMGFGGAIISDALEMRGVSKRIGLAECAVRALAAGVDGLCLGRQQTEDDVAACRAAICAAASSGRLPLSRLEEAASRVQRLRSWLAGAPRAHRDYDAGLAAARRAVRLVGDVGELRDPLVVELDAPAGIAVGDVPWGLTPLLHGPDSASGVNDPLRIDASGADPVPLLARAGGRSLIVVVRDAHRYTWKRELVSALVAGRPDTVVVEMGLPVWQPTCGAYLATYGAARVNAVAAAELLLRAA